MKRTYPGRAGFFMLVLFATLILPLAVLAMGKDPAEGEVRRERIEKTQGPGSHGQQRDSGNLFDAYAAWKDRRKELEKEKHEENFLPTEDSLAS